MPKKLLIICLILCIIIAIAIYLKNSIIIIPNNPNLKISIDYNSEPQLIITYYFYDDTVIETSYSGGVLPTGLVTSKSTTKYYFNEEIDLSELENFITEFPKETFDESLVKITEKDGTTYGIDDLNNTDKNNLFSLAHNELLNEIMKITDKSVKKDGKNN